MRILVCACLCWVTICPTAHAEQSPPFLKYPKDQKPELKVVHGADCKKDFGIDASIFKKWTVTQTPNDTLRNVRSTRFVDTTLTFETTLPQTAIVNITYSIGLNWENRSNPRKKVEKGTAQYIGATGQPMTLRVAHEEFYNIGEVTIDRMECSGIAITVPEPEPCPVCEQPKQEPAKTKDEKVMDTIRDEEFMKRFIDETR